MITRLKQIKLYATKGGQKPFVEWIESLDSVVRYRVKERLDRISLGNMGDHKYLSDGISELRLDFGCGYRIYFAEEGKTVILLLSGGNKSSQKKDIKRAIDYWKDYQSR
ncbi:MAG TPA: type II toxin-antitoxin system RelE/ParE family toxin [Gammaproteobacteria bacterium]|nr:type II toxin-antitoxin system RelE/ParE family toxin [Gammaproteobacteria bacterium]HRA42856.1 type II toxin-antitoxin system RelE/ParE family toxin [Gammaproteobacteria bacterium]